MNKRKGSIIAIPIILFFTYSCTVQRMVHLDESTGKKGYHIYGLVKNNNDWVEFNGSPAYIANGLVTGKIIGQDGEPVLFSVPEKDVKRLWIKKSSFLESLLNTLTVAGFGVMGLIPGLIYISGPITFVYVWLSL